MPKKCLIWFIWIYGDLSPLFLFMVSSIFLTILEDYSRHVWVVMLKFKSKAYDKVKSFVHMVENQFEKKVKAIRSDNGLEFLLKVFYDAKGILHQKSCVYTPEQNGRVERRHQHILNISKLPKKF